MILGCREKILIACLFLIPIVYIFLFVNCFGVNLPIFDEYDFLTLIDQYLDGKTGASFLLEKHNEHLMVIPNIMFSVNVMLTDYNVMFLLNFSALLMATFYTVLIQSLFALKPQKGLEEKILLISFLGILIMHPCQTENYLWGFQIAWFIIILIAGISFLLYANALDSHFKFRNIVIAILVFIAGLTSLHGLFVGLTITILIFIDAIKQRRINKNALIIICVWSVSFLMYFVERSDTMLDLDRNIIEVPLSILGMLGFPLCLGHAKLAVMIGIAIAVLMLYVVIKLLKKKEFTAYDTIIMSFIIYATICIAAESFGRSFFGWEEITLTQRYSTNTLMLYIGLVLYAQEYFMPKIKKQFRKMVIMGGLCLLIITAIPFVNQARNRSNYYAGVYNMTLECDTTDELEDSAKMAVRDVEVLRRRKWSLFSENSK